MIDNSGSLTVSDTLDVEGGSICGNALHFGTGHGAGAVAFATTPGTGPACGTGVATGGTFNTSLINNSAFNVEGAQNNVPITASLQTGWSWQNTSSGTIAVGSVDTLDISSPSGQSASFVQDGVIDNSGTVSVADPIPINGGTICDHPVNLGSGDERPGTLTLTFAANPSAGPACGSGQATDQLFIYNVAATIETNVPAAYTVAMGDIGPGAASVGTPGNLTNAGTLELEWDATLTVDGSNGTLTNTGTIEVRQPASRATSTPRPSITPAATSKSATPRRSRSAAPTPRARRQRSPRRSTERRPPARTGN